MAKYEEIKKALEILGLNESEKLSSIKSKYKTLLKKYHPDTCSDDKESCRKKTEEIIDAYNIILNYLENYTYSFKKEDVEKEFSVDDFWRERFGNDPVWSSNFNKKDL